MKLKSMRTQLTCIFILFLGLNLPAQKLPTSNIILFDLNQKNDSVFQFTNPKFLTDFNKNGYNNQPHFMSDNELYLTVQPEGDTSQTDIYALNLETNKMTQVTKTVESEYSPTFIPPIGRSENYEFSCVRVEMDGSQKLWRFPMRRNNKGKRVFENLENIGYHFWLDYRDLALFVVDTPHKLMVADSRDESARFITANIGRCFQRLPDGSMAFIEKMSDDTWLLKKLSPRSYNTSLITATIAKSEDFVALSDGTILMASGTALYKFNQRKDITWLKIADFGYYDMNQISRIAVNKSNSKIAFVID